MINALAANPIVQILVAIATIIGGLAAAADWLGRLRQLRTVDRILGRTLTEGPTDILISPIGRSPSIDLSLESTTSQEIIFGVMPYIDHTQAFIGQELGWFAEAGISPSFLRCTPEMAFDALERGEIDVLSATPSALVRRGSNPQEIQAFVLHDLFQGYGLMYKRRIFRFEKKKKYGDLIAEGYSHDEALQEIASYLSNRRIVHARDDAIEPFLGRIMSAGTKVEQYVDITASSEVESVRQVVRGKADFHLGGAPSRLTLERLGFDVLISSSDLMSNGMLFRDSREYLGLIQCGWFASKAWIEKSPDLALRTASVSYRISAFICQKPNLAASIHLRYLNRTAGTSLRVEDIKKAYKDLHPFQSFEDQTAWFYDPSDPMNVAVVTTNIINYWRRTLPAATFEHVTCSADIISADRWHRELLQLRRQCIWTVHEIQRADASFVSSATYRAVSQLFYSYNYMDCLQVLSTSRKPVIPPLA